MHSYFYLYLIFFMLRIFNLFFIWFYVSYDSMFTFVLVPVFVLLLSVFIMYL